MPFSLKLDVDHPNHEIMRRQHARGSRFLGYTTFRLNAGGKAIWLDG